MPNRYQPDILSCLANLSSDEVFTPPEIANQMLDMLPQELFQSTETTFLDPCSKTGVFLREITKRLLEAQIPGYTVKTAEINQKRENNIELSMQDAHFEEHLQDVLNHILTKQVFGIAITELTSLLTRRSLYCSKYANGKYSICTAFKNHEGNIRFRPMKHTWNEGQCVYCGVSKVQYDRPDEMEQHAYEFIHTEHIEEVLKNMQFDVIIGNPPYQLADSGYGISAKPIYDKFIQQAKKLNPRYISMIVPSRWFAGGKGLDSFRNEMLHDRRLRIMHDYPNAYDCFSGVQIKGGICYFLWDRDNEGDCAVYTHHGNTVDQPVVRPLLENGCDTFIRYNTGVDIYRKVKKHNEPTMETIVSSRKPFGLDTTFHGNQRPSTGDVKIYENQGVSYIKRTLIPNGADLIDRYKVFIPRSSNGSDSFPHPILGKPFVGYPNTACSETYIVIGPFKSKNECENVISYIQTKFMRTLAMFKKVTQSTLKTLYTFVPMQDFSQKWSDEKLYKKYGLTHKEIEFIESMIRPMDLNGDDDDGE